MFIPSLKNPSLDFPYFEIIFPLIGHINLEFLLKVCLKFGVFFIVALSDFFLESIFLILALLMLPL